MYSDLPARPIMLYPPSEEQRKVIEKAAGANHQKLSPYILNLVQEHIKRTSPEVTLAATLREHANRIIVHDDMDPSELRLRIDLLRAADLLTKETDLLALTPEARGEFIRSRFRKRHQENLEFLRLCDRRYHPIVPKS